MNEKQKRYCCKISQHYGLQNQAIVKHHRYGTMDGVLEELADVEIMLAQIRMALNEEQLAKVDLITQSKLERQIARIRSGE